jgi:hypothetical protein
LKVPLNFWPFDGATLDNTIDFSFNFSFADNETQNIIVAGSNAATNPPIGTTQITFQPRLSYALSQRVNAAAFWQYTQTKRKPLAVAPSSPPHAKSSASTSVFLLVISRREKAVSLCRSINARNNVSARYSLDSAI